MTIAPLPVKMELSWKQRLEPEFAKPYFAQLVQFVKSRYRQCRVYPPPKDIFRAFELSPFEKTRVVILGQDPYHGPGQADGLCFSVRPGVPPPPSLVNIFRELRDDLGQAPPATGDLTCWARQGVLLLNATLTVEEHHPGAHHNRGWELFTDAVVRQLAMEKSHVVFILWGSYAQRKGAVVPQDRHLVLRAAHPSPLSAHRGFFGSRPFSQANAYLRGSDLEVVRW